MLVELAGAASEGRLEGTSREGCPRPPMRVMLLQQAVSPPCTRTQRALLTVTFPALAPLPLPDTAAALAAAASSSRLLAAEDHARAGGEDDSPYKHQRQVCGGTLTSPKGCRQPQQLGLVCLLPRRPTA